MKRLYWSDTYLFEHQTRIAEIGTDEHGHYLRLDETIFHPQGGGQPSDEGSINDIPVQKLKNVTEENEINHYVTDVSAFKIGEFVNCMISREKRLYHSALHTAGHIIGGILRTKNHYEHQLSANHFPDQARVEFALQQLMQKEDLEKAAQLIIQEKKEITEKEGENGLRLIQIQDLWCEPCSGTHVHYTNEIFNFYVRKIENKKQKLTVGYSAEYQKI